MCNLALFIMINIIYGYHAVFQKYFLYFTCVVGDTYFLKAVLFSMLLRYYSINHVSYINIFVVLLFNGYKIHSYCNDYKTSKIWSIASFAGYFDRFGLASLIVTLLSISENKKCCYNVFYRKWWNYQCRTSIFLQSNLSLFYFAKRVK